MDVSQLLDVALRGTLQAVFDKVPPPALTNDIRTMQDFYRTHIFPVLHNFDFEYIADIDKIVTPVDLVAPSGKIADTFEFLGLMARNGWSKQLMSKLFTIGRVEGRYKSPLDAEFISQYKRNTTKETPKKSGKEQKLAELRDWILQLNQKLGELSGDGSYKRRDVLPDNIVDTLLPELKKRFATLGFGLGNYFVSRASGGYKLNHSAMQRLGFSPSDLGQTAFEMLIRSDGFNLAPARARPGGVQKRPKPRQQKPVDRWLLTHQQQEL